jgi:hypothetical protein
MNAAEHAAQVKALYTFSIYYNLNSSMPSSHEPATTGYVIFIKHFTFSKHQDQGEFSFNGFAVTFKKILLIRFIF